MKYKLSPADSFQKKTFGELVFLHPSTLIIVTHNHLEFFRNIIGYDDYVTFNRGDSFLIISQHEKEERFFKVLCKFGIGFINGDFI